ncbi:MAG: hypothetical protein ACJ76N_29710 [Thermoanaerobaculia bacterium]
MMKTQSADDAWSNLAKRIEGLERQNRFFRLISLLSVLLLSAVLLMAQSRRGSTLTAERFELVDGSGKTRAVLGITDLGPSFQLYDKSGKTRAGLLVGDRGPALLLGDADEKLRLSLRVDGKGPAIELADAGGRKRISLDLENGSQQGFLCLDPRESPDCFWESTTAITRISFSMIRHQNSGHNLLRATHSLREKCGLDSTCVILPNVAGFSCLYRRVVTPRSL